MHLGDFAPEFPQFCRLLCILNSFGNQLEIQIPAQSNNGLDISSSSTMRVTNDRSIFKLSRGKRWRQLKKE